MPCNDTTLVGVGVDCIHADAGILRTVRDVQLAYPLATHEYYIIIGVVRRLTVLSRRIGLTRRTQLKATHPAINYGRSQTYR